MPLLSSPHLSSPPEEFAVCVNDVPWLIVKRLEETPGHIVLGRARAGATCASAAGAAALGADRRPVRRLGQVGATCHTAHSG